MLASLTIALQETAADNKHSVSRKRIMRAARANSFTADLRKTPRSISAPICMDRLQWFGFGKICRSTTHQLARHKGRTVNAKHSILLSASVFGLVLQSVSSGTVIAQDDFFDQADRVLVNGEQVAPPTRDPLPRDGSNLQWWGQKSGSAKPQASVRPQPAAVPKPSTRRFPKSGTVNLHLRTSSRVMVPTAKPARVNPLQNSSDKIGSPTQQRAASTTNVIRLIPVPSPADQLSPRQTTQQLAWSQDDEKGSVKNAPSKSDVKGTVDATLKSSVLNQSINDINVSIALPPKEEVNPEDPEAVPTLPEDRAIGITCARPTWMREFAYQAETTRIPVGMHYCFYSRPLYYEDANLERCGYSLGLYQNLVSAAHFFGTTALLPYHIGSQPPQDCVWGKGDCPQCSIYSFADNYLPPESEEGTWLQAGAVTGLFLLIP